MSDVRTDYTLNYIFTRGYIKSRDLFDTIMYSDFPWDKRNLRVIRSEYEYKGGSDDLFPCGTAKEINLYREVAEVEKGERCECCGRIVLRVPFARQFGGLLCERCSRHLGYMYNKDEKRFIRERSYEEPWWCV